jgi:hypothetical protein
VSDITLLDSWVISAQGHFTNNTDLFPRKISNSYNGCPMKAVVRDNFWYITAYHNFSSRGRPNAVGLEVNLFEMVLNRVNMTYMFVNTPQGFETLRASTRHLRKAMIAKKVYIALGGVGTNYLLESVFESTNAYIELTASWHVPCPAKYARWSSMFRILRVELWVVLVISIVVVAISTTLLARYSCTSEWSGYKTLTGSLTKMWAVVLGVAVATTPRTPSLRSLFLAWVCFCVAFSTVFQAFLTTFLVDSGHTKPFQNIEDVSAAGISFYYKQEYKFLIEGNKSAVLGKRREPTPVMEWASYHKNVSLFYDDLFIQGFYARGEYVDENGESLLCKLKDGPVYKNGISMIMFHGDPLLRRVSEIIDRVVEAGLYNHWISLKMDSDKLHARKIALVNPLGAYYSFNIHHMQPPFYLLSMGLCLSSVCFIVELLYNRLSSKIM